VPQEHAALRELGLPYPVCHAAKVPQSVESARWHVEQETPQAFHGLERQGAEAVAVPGILGAQGPLAVL
jgi:hypothetical protein